MNPTLNSGLEISQTLRMELQPRPGLTLDEAKDKFLALNPKHRVLDHGDEKQPVILAVHEQSKTVYYKFIPEMSPPGMTIQQAAEHMKKAGWDVRGISPSKTHIVVSEMEKL